MERLSEKLESVIDECVNAWNQIEEDTCKDAIQRLAAYEDIGLTPEEVKDMAENAETRLLTWFEARYGFSVGKLMDLLEAKQQGRLVELPCKVGDKVYSKDGKVAEIEGFCVDKHGITAQVSFQCDYDCNDCAFNSWHTEYSGENSCDGEYGVACVSDEQFGKTVFLTREEAEAALKGGADHE